MKMQRLVGGAGRMRRAAAFGAVLIISAWPAHAVATNADSQIVAQYPHGTLEALTAPPADTAAMTVEQLRRLPGGANLTLTTAPVDIVVQGDRLRRRPAQARVSVAYAGRQRPTSPEMLRAIDAWGGMVAGRQGTASEYRTEYAFLEAGRTYWIPVRSAAARAAPQPFDSTQQQVLGLTSIGWLADGRPIVLANFALPGSGGGGRDRAAVPFAAAQPGVPPAAPQPGGDPRYDPANFRLLALAKVMDVPSGEILPDSPLGGIREDQVRATATFTRNVRPSTRPDSRLREAWVRTRGYRPEVARAFSHEYEFSDGRRSFWLPVYSLAAPVLHGVRAGDPVELYVHRFDAPKASGGSAGPEAIVIAVFASATERAGREGAFTTFSQGSLRFRLGGRRYDLPIDPRVRSTFVDNARVGGTSSLSLRFDGPGMGSGLILVNGLRGPGRYRPDELEVLGEVRAGQRAGLRGVSRCEAVISRLDANAVEGRIDCPAQSDAPVEIGFAASTR